MPRRTTWRIDMGDGTWAAACSVCGALARDRELEAEQVAIAHRIKHSR